MSHYPVLVCLDAQVDLAQVPDQLHRSLAPYDENRRVPAYRDHLDGQPAGHPLTDELCQRGWTLLDLPERPLTWASVVDAFNAEYGHHGDDDPQRLHLDPDGRPYQRSTYNPLSRWDWFAVGGRWSGYFPPAGGAARRNLVQPRDGRCDGGRLRSLDLAAERAAAVVAASRRYDGWERVCADTPAALPWTHYAEQVRAGVLDLAAARAAYHDQPRIGAATRVLGLHPLAGCPVDEFRDSRQAYLAAARAAAVPGYALVLPPDTAADTDRWISPGRMGWFGASTDTAADRDAYHDRVNTYLDSADPNSWLVAVDLHI